ncbi:MAG: response regulator [Methylococcales bacterium]|nr:response regulator [Methylococcales bacterium]
MSLKIKKIHCSISQKLLLLITSITATALLCASIAIIYGGRQLFLERLQEDMAIFTELTAMNSSAAVMFEDEIGAAKMLANLRSDPSIITVALYKADNQLLSHYIRQGSNEIPPHHLPSPSITVSDKSIRINQFIKIDNEKIGGIHIESDLSRLDAVTIKLIYILVIIAVSVLVLAMLFSVRLQRLITTPIIKLTRITRKVTQTRDFSKRAHKTGQDEVGTLIDGFNHMMGEIESRDRILQQNNRELAIARQEAIDASEAKGNFLAKMSHEIRTSMNGVLGMLELLDDTLLQDEQQDFARTARNSASALLNVIDDVLDFSKIEAGCLEIETIDMELLPLCEDVTALLADKAHNKGIELTCLVHSDVPSIIISDPTRLRQILLNLISNSIKFTSVGEVGLNVSLLKSDSKETITLKFAVSDTGIGISPEQQHKLFNAFSQVDVSTTRQFGGTGLGLSICKQLVELMHGSIHVDSEAGEGATFWFQLSVKTSDFNSSNHDSINHKNILIVDDNKTSRLILEYYCQNWGITYKSYSHATLALDFLNNNTECPFDAAIIDSQMPEIDGFQLVNKIRSHLFYTDLPILMLGSTTSSVMAQNVNASLMKPVRQTSLFKSLSKLLLPQKTLISTEKAIILPSFNAHVLLVDDNHVNQKVARNFLQKLNVTADVCDNGKEALTMIKQHHYDLIFMDCHMPVMDGYLATQAIRKEENKEDGLLRSHLTVIAMTANVLAGEEEKCINAGMDGYLQKPVKLHDLIKLITQWVPEKQHQNTDEITENHDEKSFNNTNNILQKNAIKLHMEYDLYHELLNDFYREHHYTVKQIKELIVENQYQSAMLLLHRLKGTAGNLGFQVIFDHATEIEKKIMSMAKKQDLLVLFTDLMQETDSIMALIQKEAHQLPVNEIRVDQVENTESFEIDEVLSQLATNLLIHSYSAKQDCKNLAQLAQTPEQKESVQKIELAINQLNYQQAYEWLNKMNGSFKHEEVLND